MNWFSQMDCTTWLRGCTSWKYHEFVWGGVALRVGDMMTDIAFNIINLGVIGQNESSNDNPSLFYTKCRDNNGSWLFGGTADDVRWASAVFLIIGCGLTLADVCGAFRRGNSAVGSAICCGFPRISIITLLITLLEDCPQLAINYVYLRTVGGLDKEKKAGAYLSVVSLSLSLLAIFYSLYTVVSDRKKAKEYGDNDHPKTLAGTSVVPNQAFDESDDAVPTTSLGSSSNLESPNVNVEDTPEAPGEGATAESSSDHPAVSIVTPNTNEVDKGHLAVAGRSKTPAAEPDGDQPAASNASPKPEKGTCAGHLLVSYGVGLHCVQPEPYWRMRYLLPYLL